MRPQRVLKDNDVLRNQSGMEEKMQRIKKYLTISFIAFVVMAAIAVAARAQSTTMPFTAKVQGEVTVPQNIAAPSAQTVRIVRVPDTRQISELNRQLGEQDATLASYRDRLVAAEAEKARLTDEANRLRDQEDGNIPWWWLLVALGIGLLIGRLWWHDDNPNDRTVNHFYGRGDASDRGPEGLEFRLGRDLEEGDEIIFRKVYPQPERLEVTTTERLDVTPNTAQLMKDLISMILKAKEKGTPETPADPAPKPGSEGGASSEM